MSWAGHVERAGESRAAYWASGFRSGNLRKRDHLKDVGVHVKIILKWIFQELRLGH